MNEPLTKEDMYQLQQAISLLQTKVDKALSYLYDDVNTSSPGLVQMCRDHEKRLEEIEEQIRSNERDKKKLSSFWGIIGGAVVMLIAKLIEYFITKK
jgi:hypothetical protein